MRSFPEAELATETAASVNDVKGAPRRGKRIGNWLTREQAQELLSLPDRESLKGKCDYAILALLLGCGLRRTELVSEVKVGAIAQRENRWVLVDTLRNFQESKHSNREIAAKTFLPPEPRLSELQVTARENRRRSPPRLIRKTRLKRDLLRARHRHLS